MRLALLALATTAACVPARIEPKCRLLGTWAHILPSAGDPSWADAEQVQTARSLVERNGYSTTETFQGDGIWISRHALPAEQRLRWNIVENGSDRMTILIEFPNEHGGQMLRHFVFESPDLIHEVRDAYAGMRLARVPDPR